MGKQTFTLLEDPFSALNQDTPSNNSSTTGLASTGKEIFINSTTNTVRNSIADLYNNFMMTKTHSQGTYGVYKALVESMTSGSIRYIAAIVAHDSFNPLGTVLPLRDLQWISFQTRTTTNPRLEFAGLPLKEQAYVVKRNNSLWDKIKLASELDEKYVYIPDHLPLSVHILRLKESDSFAPEGSVISALELFQTIIVLEQV